MSSNKTVRSGNLEAELVIIGGGGSGLAAAVAAAEEGTSNIVVLEKRGIGGSTAMAGGLFGIESPVQKRAGMDTSRDEVFKQAMNWAHWQSNPRIVRAYIDKSGDTIRWLEGKGIEFVLVPLHYGQWPITWHVPGGKPFGRMPKVMKTLTEECERLGVQLITRSPVKKLLTSAKGEVIGVLAKTKEGELTVTSKAVIIASGGYGGNKRLLKKYYPYYDDDMHYGGVPQNTGDGLLMAMEIGADTEALGLILGGGPGGAPPAPPMKLGSPPDTIDVPFAAVLSNPYLVCVNKKGKRFFDETMIPEHRSYCNRSIRGCYTLFDRKIVQYMDENGVSVGHGPYRMQQRTRLPGLAKALQEHADKGLLKISDSWDEIAEYLGIDPKALKNTIEEYNTACDHGYDPIFVKNPKWLWPLRTPPYYAIGGDKSGMLDTLGGIKINEHMQVLDKQANPITGLYAAGVCAGGWQAEDYCGYYMSGAAVGFAINSGRIAGENASRFASELKS